MKMRVKVLAIKGLSRLACFPSKCSPFSLWLHAFRFCVLDCLSILSYSSGLILHFLTQEEEGKHKGGSGKNKVETMVGLSIPKIGHDRGQPGVSTRIASL
jgi:hypothetical protein